MDGFKEILGNTTWFDGDWYERFYKDVSKTGLTPLDHFIKYGMVFGRKISYRFPDALVDKGDVYLENLRGFLDEGRFDGVKNNKKGADYFPFRPKYSFKNSKNNRVERKAEGLRKRLYEFGFEEKAVSDIKELASSKNPEKKYRASLLLADYYLNEVGATKARDAIALLDECLKFQVAEKERVQCILMKADGLLMIDRRSAALQMLKKAKKVFGYVPDIELMYANLSQNVEKINIVNDLYRYYELLPIRLEGERYEYDALTQDESFLAPAVTQGPLVSIIVPCYNCEDTLETTIEAVTRQTWKNLEILLVDDRSTDATFSKMQAWSKKDKRIKVFQTPANSGPYVARNIALEASSGKYVTCNDSDDWSHCQKIEIQIKHLESNPQIIANKSAQARVTESLQFYRRGKFGQYLFQNMSSLMFRREAVVEKVGFWDSVRFGADSEFVSRIKKTFGYDTVVELATGPLSFQRQTEGSLTGSSKFGYNGFFMGARKDYYDAYRQHHFDSESFYIPRLIQTRPFPLPKPMRPNRSNGHVNNSNHYDVIIISDFRMVGGSTLSSVEEMKAHKKAGLRTGLVQMYRYDYEPVKKPINPKVREQLDETTSFIVYGEEVSCDTLIIRYPPVLQHLQKYVPKIEAKRVNVIVNQPPMSDYSDSGELRYSMPQCQENVLHYFGQKATWYPIGQLVRDALHEHHQQDLDKIELSPVNWENIIDQGFWEREERPSTSKLTIGRHSRDNPVKWPNTAESILEVYPEQEDVEVVVLGGANKPASIIGHLPKNWRVYEFGEKEPWEYLKEVDVFIYFSHPDWVESFGRVILEAIAANVPVILPPFYQPVFGDSALYAEASDAVPLARRLYEDPVFYNERVKRAATYVQNHFSYETHYRRLGIGVGSLKVS